MHRILTKDEVRNAIVGQGGSYRIPVFINFWLHHWEYPSWQQEDVMRLMARYPSDVQVIGLNTPHLYKAPADDAEYIWLPASQATCHINADQESRAYDARVALPDWSGLDELLDRFPDPSYPGLIPRETQPDGRYALGHWWFCLFERHWSLRGMENALIDYYEFPEQVHRLFRKLTDFYKAVIIRASRELAVDGIMTSDDLGTQSGTFFSPAIFREFFLPYYREIIDTAHQQQVQFWLHSCGNITQFLPDLIDLGLDVIHPIQKYAMDENDIARYYGNQISFLAGFDVQRIIPWGTAEEVRTEVRHLIEIYQKSDGRLIFSLGNVLNGECSLELLEALYDEVFSWKV